MRQVLDEVARREHVVAVPRTALRVLRQRALAAGEEVVRVADALQAGERGLRGAAVVDRRRPGQHRVDRGRDELDVAELLGRDAAEQVVERPRALAGAEVERLERVVQPGRHLAELAAQQLLHGGGAGRIRVGRRWQLDTEPVNANDHREAPLIGGASDGCRSVGCRRRRNDACRRCARRRRRAAFSLARRSAMLFISLSASFSSLEVRRQELRDLRLAHRLGRDDQALVRGDLVVLGPSAGAGQERVEHRRRGRLLLDELVVLLLDPVDAGALLGLGLLAERLEGLLDVRDVLPGLVQVVAERLRELLVGRLLLQLRKRLHQRLLGVEDVAELVQEQLARLGHLSHEISFVVCPGPRSHCGG